MKCDRDGKQPSSTVSLQKSRSVACVPSFCQHRNTSAWSREEEAGLRGRGARGGGRRVNDDDGGCSGSKEASVDGGQTPGRTFCESAKQSVAAFDGEVSSCNEVLRCA